MPGRLDFFRFLVGAQEIEVAWDLAVEIRERCAAVQTTLRRAKSRTGCTQPVRRGRSY